MKKNFAKKIMATVLSLSMIVGTASIVSAAHAENGSDIATAMKWDSFSVRDDLHNGGTKNEWALALDEEIAKTKDQALADYVAGKINQEEYEAAIAEADSYQSYTEGYFTDKQGSAGFDFYCKNTGWDGEYYRGNLVADNPWGLTVQSKTGIAIEKGRKYTISFKIRSTLRTEEKDDDGNEVVDENGNKKYITTKHIGFKAYDTVSNGGPAVEFDSIVGASTAGIIELNYQPDDTKWQEVTAQLTIPTTYGSDYMGVMFSMGAYQVQFPKEIAMTGFVYVKDFKIVAGDQYRVTYSGNGKTVSAYVNTGARTSPSTSTAMTLGKKNYTIDYYTLNGSKYNFSSAVTKDITLVAHYVKTKKPAKASITKANMKTKKKAKLTFKKLTNAVGYQVRYSYKKNMKGAKKKSSKKVTCTISKLKSGKFLYIQARAYNTDSLGNELYGKWSAKKTVVVR